MADNPLVAIAGVIIVTVISIMVLGAHGSEALETCDTAVTIKCSNAAQPIPCTRKGIITCDNSPLTTNTIKRPKFKMRPNREIVLQGNQ